MTLGEVSGADEAATPTELDHAQALAVTLSDVTLWVGPGGALSDAGNPHDIADGATFADDTVESGDLGFLGHVGSLKLASVKSLGTNATDPSDDVSYLALELTGLSAKLIGIDGLTFGIYDAAVKVNKVSDGDTDATNDPAKLDWSTFTATEGAGLLPDLTVNSGVDIDVQGSVALDAFGALIAKGSFRLQFGIVTDLGDNGLPGGGDDTEYQAMVVTLGTTAFENAEAVQVFVGVGGLLEDVAGDDNDADGSYSDDVVNKDDAIGFYTSLESLSLVTLKNIGDPTVATDDLGYLAVYASGVTAELVGIDDSILTLKIWDGIIRINQASDTDDVATTTPQKIDWTTFSSNTEGLSVPTLDVNDTVSISVAGSLVFDLAGFVQVFGSFAFTVSSGIEATTVTKPGVVTDGVAMKVITFGLSDVNVFVGSGPYFEDSATDGNNVIDAADPTNDAAVGLLLQNVSLALALFKPVTGLGSYYALMASAQDIELVGLNFGISSAFSIDASGYRVEMNGGSYGTDDAAIDFSKMDGGSFNVDMGPGLAFSFDYTSALQRVAIENAVLKIDDYFYISGGLSFTRQQGMTVTLTGDVQTSIPVDVFAFGAGSVDLFAGYSPNADADHDGHIDDVLAEGATGLALQNVNFGLVIMRPTVGNQSVKYIALKATANFAGLIGIDDFTLSASGLTVEYNGVRNPSNPADTKVVDFSALPDGAYKVDTGNGELDIDFDAKRALVSVAEAHLQISDYVFVHGALAFEKVDDLNDVQIANGGPTKNMSATNVGGQDLTMFFGSGGPYWTDLDGDGDASWAFNTGNGNTASRTISAGSVTIGSTTYTVGQVLPVNVVGTLPAGDLLTFGDASAGTEVTYGDINGDGFVDANETGELNPDAVGLAINDADLALALLTPKDGSDLTRYTALRASSDFVGFVGSSQFNLQASNVVVELNIASRAGATAPPDVVDFSLFNGGAGYEIDTGAAPQVIDFANRRIHASADDVLVNVSEFLYLKGNIAIDMGSRETVIITTGIPSDLGALANDLVTQINDALQSAVNGLEDLKDEVIAQIKSAIETVRDMINDQVDSIVDMIFQQISSSLNASLEQAIGAVTDSLKSQLQSATEGVSQQVDQAIDQLLAPVVANIDAPFDQLVKVLLVPVKELIRGVIGDQIQDALTTGLDGIASSVSTALQTELDGAEIQVKAKIHSILDPQIERVVLKLEQLIAKVQDRVAPVFQRLHSLLSIKIGENFATIEDVEVDVTAIGISNATAFVGLPPSDGLDFDQPIGEQNAIGLFIQNLNMALGLFKPVVGKGLPDFTAVKITADSAGFVDGGSNIFQLTAQDITVELNLGGKVVPGPFGNGTIDFVRSFSGDDGADPVIPPGYRVDTGTTSDPIYLDFQGEKILASVGWAELTISEFVHIAGSFAFEKGAIQRVDVTGGATSAAAHAFLDALGLDLPAGAIPAMGATETELSFMTIGAANVHAFIGMNGPYWSDLDGDQLVSWAFNTGNGDDASRTVTAGSVTIDSVTYGVNMVLPTNVVGKLRATDGVVTVGGVSYGDIDHDGVVDANETGELNDDAKGLWIDDFDFGMAIMRPTNPLDFAKYFALKANANGISMVGIEDVTVHADNLVVEINQSSPSVYGVPLFPVVDFASTYSVNEQKILFALFDTDGNHVISTAEMGAALAAGYAGPDLQSADELVALLHVGGAPPGVLTVKQVLDQLASGFATEATIGLIKAADADNDGKFDPDGYEVNTGGTPVYLSMDSSLIRAQGFLELNLFDTVFLTGSVAFELGPTHTVTLTGTPTTTKEVSTMTIGAADVTAFIGASGPYWTDVDGDHEVSWAFNTGNGVSASRTILEGSIKIGSTTYTVGQVLPVNVVGRLGAGEVLTMANGTKYGDIDGDGVIDANETDELNENAVGFEITDLDVGIALMVSTDPTDLGVYLAGKLDVHSFGLVGIDGLTATGTFSVELNVGFGLTGFEPDLRVIDFSRSFNEVAALFNLIDADHNATLDTSELTAALATPYAGASLTTVQQLITVLNIGGAPPLGGPSVADVLSKLSASFKLTNEAAIRAADADDDGKLDLGFEINTGNPTAPAVLDFDRFLVNIQLGGEIELQDVFRLYGVFLFEADSSGLKAFVAAGLEFGPDIGASQGGKLFVMNALGALVITGDGIAADIDVSVSVGGALSSVLALNAEARFVINTTGVDQSITIPARYVDFLKGDASLNSLPPTANYDTAQLASLTGPLDSRFTQNADGSATFTIQGGAPRLDGSFDADGAYVLVAMHGKLTVASTFVISADFQLKISEQGLELGFNGTIDLGGFVTLDVAGGAVVEDGVFAAYLALDVNFDVPGIDINISGGAVLEINSGNVAKDVYDAQGTGHTIARNTFMVTVNADIDLFGILDAEGTVKIGVTDGTFLIELDATLDFFDILDVDIEGFFRVAANGSVTFSFTGSLDLDLTTGSGAGEFGITGSLSVTVSNSGFSGYGDVNLVIFGEEIDIASATVSVNWDTGDWLIRAEGPLGIWLEVTSSDSFPYFSLDGGLGVFDAIFDAIGDAAEAVGEAFVDAANAVAGAFEDLGTAILDFGQDVLDFANGLITDLADLASDVFDAIASAFDSDKTEVIRIDPSASYSYTTSLVGGTLTITNASASRLALAIVKDSSNVNQLVIDAPDVTANVIVAAEVHYHRSFDASGWPWEWGWGPWHETSRTNIYRDVTFSNTSKFLASSVSKIVINGTNNSETIIEDRASIGIDTDVYGNGGDDIIVTGRGNDRVWGGYGNDTIFTYEGNDEQYGEDGDDKLTGGTGNDLLNGGNGDDYLDENDERLTPDDEISETNTLIGGAGKDIIVGSPGKDTIDGGSGDDVLLGLANDDTYVFGNGYGTDKLVDYHGMQTLDFSGMTDNLTLAMTDIDANIGLTANAGTGNSLVLDSLVPIDLVKLGKGNDNFAITKLPNHQFNITDEGGSDIYDLDFDAADAAKSVARLDIFDKAGTTDRIDLDLDSTGFDIYLHPLQVLLNNLNLTFNAGVEQLNLTDHASAAEGTTITTEPTAGPKLLLIKSGVTITQANGGDIDLRARGDFTLETGALVQTTGDVDIYADEDNVDPPGATILVLGQIVADDATVHGTDNNDTITIGAVNAVTEMTVYAGTGNDTINVGMPAPGTVDAISGNLTVFGEDGIDVLNVEDTADGNANIGTLTATEITGLDMGGGITYGTVETLNIGLGSGGDTFTIKGTSAGATNINGNAGNDVFNIEAISGPTTINGGNDSDTFYVGANVARVDDVDGALTIHGNDPTSGSDWLYVDDSADTTDNTGILTSTTITGLGMAAGITYDTIEHLVISLGTGADTFTINGTHGAATNPFQEETTLDVGAGTDIVYINDVTDRLFVNGEAGADTLNVNGTGTGSTSMLDGDAGDDVFNVIAMNGAVTVDGGADNDTINVSSDAPLVPTAPTNQVGTIDNINALLTVNGGAGTDTLNVDDSDPAVTNKSGTLTATTLRGLALEQGIDYSQLEGLNIWLATGANTFTINSTHGGSTTVNTAEGQDTINIDSSGGVLTVNTEEAADTINVRGTGAGSQTFINTQSGDDVINVRTINGATTINAGDDADTINVGSNAAGIVGNASVNTGGNVDQIGALLTINGNGQADVLNVDDTGDVNANDGVLTFSTITGLDMVGSIAYGTIETLNIGLGSGGDTFKIASTHSGETNVNGNAGNDVFNIQTISGTTTVNGGNDSDTFNVGSKAPEANGLVDGIGASLTVNGNDPTSGDDWLYVDDTGDTTDNAGVLTSTRITGLGMAVGITYGTIEHLVISLGSGNDNFTINSTHGVATSAFQEDTTLNTGSGDDQAEINDVTDKLVVNGQDNADTINVNGTGLDSVSVLNGGAGDDIFNVRAMNGRVSVRGGDDNDTTNVGDLAPALPSGPRTTPTSSIDLINALLDVDGGNGTQDILNIDDSAAPASNNKIGILTPTSLTGLDLEESVEYVNLDKLNIWLGFGNNVFTINGTHAGETTVSTAKGTDLVAINGARGLLTVNGEEDADTFDVRATGVGSEVRLNGQEGADTFNLSDQSPALPAAYPATLPPPAATTSGKVDSIDGLVVIDGGADFDAINVDDSANTTNKVATLTSNTLRGLDMPRGVNYSNAEDFNLWLGTGTDGLYIDSTHAGTTDVFMGDGNATVNQRDDTVAIRSISGVTTIHGQGGNDFFYVNVQAAANDNFDTQFKQAVAATANDNQVNALFYRTNANGIGAVLNLHGEGGSDQYTVNLAGEGDALINVLDNGAPDDGVDMLTVNGADVVSGLANNPDDTFLLRRDLVAVLNGSAQGGGFTHAERVNYDENINARLIVNGLGGNDTFVVDDNSAITTLDGGDGDDTFQIGQVFGTPRTTAMGLDAADAFDTTPIIIGTIRDPNSAHWVNGVAPIIFDPTSFDPINGTLPQATIDAINAAIAYQTANGNKALDGVAYVSSGATHAMTVFGGGGNDIFSVYHNKATLRLEGEEGNDQFVVRAFVTLDLSKQGDTEVSGGDGTDTINYAINAPVSIDGGSGFDKVVVLGTPFNDNFVVTSQGIFGANLNVTFENIESAELDTLEGNDTIFVLGTNPNMVTTVIGGLGSDTIQVLGDVTQPIVSNDQGRSGVITQGLSSADPNFDNVGAGGVAVNVLAAAGESLVKIDPVATPLLTAEGGVQAFYLISLVSPDASALAANPVYLTVSAGVVSGTDRRAGGAGVLVSVDGVTFTNAVVLKFDGTSATTVFKIWVKAINDTAAEGPQVALISHSIVTDNAAYRDLPLVDVVVNVIDDDQPGVDIRHLVETAPNTFAPDVSTQVLEGTSGFGDVYSVALTAAPAAGETVTVTLWTDTQVTARSKATGLTQLTFTVDNWNTPQLVVVSAVDDTALDGTELSTITHRIASTGGKYSAFPSADYPELSVTVYDNETPGLIVQETDGSTIVVENGASDSYQVRLTSAPSSDVTLTIRTDKQTFLSSSADTFRIVDESGTKSYYEYAFTFTAANWNKWATIDVRANPAFAGTDSVFKAFPPQDQNLDRIRGPLIIEGGIGSEGADRSLRAPVLLPNEIDQPSNQELSNPASEPSGIDTLNIFHTDNADADVGSLFYRTTDAAGHAIRNPGLALTGFEMGGDLIVNQGTTETPDFLYFGGGITYNGLEVVEVLLGKGNETLTIDDTGDRDEKANVSPDPATITAIHGGGGDDTIIANNRGHGPLVIYGDTSLDGIRYSNDQPAASTNGTTFNNPGNDTIDASRMPNKNDGFAGVVIYGGTGNDTIFGGQDDDHLAGGAGNDAIDGGAGNDHIYGDAAFDVNLLLFAQDQITPFSPVTQLAQINGMFTVTSVGVTGTDTIRAGDGNDIVLGDHGVIDQLSGTRRLQTTDFVTRVTSVNRSNGAADTIYGDGGEDVLVGGASGDRIDGGAGRDLIFGDNVRLDRTIGDDMNNARYRTLTGAEGGQIYSTLPGTAGNVLVNSASGGISGGGAVWEDFNIELLDHDLATQTAGGNNFGNDYIAGGADDDEIFGELGNDIIQGDGSIDYTVGATRSADGTLVVQPSMEAATDGNDYIEGNGGNDVIFGNLGQDDIISGSSSLFSLTSPVKRPDGSDIIFGGAGTDISRDDSGDGIHGRDADVILGDNGNIYRIIGTPGFNYDDAYGEQIIVRAAQLLDYTPGGQDYNAAAAAQDIGAADEIHGESGDDVIYAQVGNDVAFGEGQDDQIIGGYGSDWISGGTGDDAVLGDDGRIFVSRNSTLGEPLYGIAGIPQNQLNAIIENSNGNLFAVTNVAGALKYTVDLTPYSVDPANAAPTTLMPRALYANDIIYGGLGNDTLHGGAGEDAISGAEAPTVSYVTNYTQAGVKIGVAIRSDYSHPVNPGNVLGYNPTTTKFALYDADDPLRKILLAPNGELSKTGTGLEWVLNFNDSEGPLDTHWIIGSSYTGVPTDGDDVIFGDLGSDWMVGGTGRDTIWSGWGDDLANLDDKLSTFTGPDTNPSWEDLVFGGAGRDVMIGNTGGDRLIDWNGEFNSYWMPYNPFGAPAVSRSMAPAIETFLLALSKSQGADPTLAAQYGGSAARNGEPFGETGMVRHGDAASSDQNGGPRDPQGPVVKAKRDVRVSAGIQPQWETAAESAPVDSAAAMSVMSDATLAATLQQAKLSWTEKLGAGDARLAVLNSANIQFGNLPGDRLGLTLGVNVYIDSDAAGRGWQTMDLLSVVTHELGHLLGFDHDDAGTFGVMSETLEAGAHNQPVMTGNTIALPALAGVVTDANEAQHVSGLQPNGASIVTVNTDGLGSTGWIDVHAISFVNRVISTVDVNGAGWMVYSGGAAGNGWNATARPHTYGGRDDDHIDMDGSQIASGVDSPPSGATEAGMDASDAVAKVVHPLRADLAGGLNLGPRKATNVPREAVDAQGAMSLDWTASSFQDLSNLLPAQEDGSRAVVTTPTPDDRVDLSLAAAGSAGDDLSPAGHEGADWAYAFDWWLSHAWRKSGAASAVAMSL